MTHMFLCCFVLDLIWKTSNKYNRKKSVTFLGYYFYLGLKNCKLDTFHKADLLIAFAVWTQFKQTAEQATIQAFMRALQISKVYNSAKLKMLQIPYLVTLWGIAVKGVDILSSGEQIYGLLFKRSVKHLLRHSQRICVCKYPIKCFWCVRLE